MGAGQTDFSHLHLHRRSAFSRRVVACGRRRWATTTDAAGWQPNVDNAPNADGCRPLGGRGWSDSVRLRVWLWGSGGALEQGQKSTSPSRLHSRHKFSAPAVAGLFRALVAPRRPLFRHDSGRGVADTDDI